MDSHLQKQPDTTNIQTIAELLDICRKSSDFVSEAIEGTPFSIHYYKSMVDKKVLQRSILPVLHNPEYFGALKEVGQNLPIEDLKLTDSPDDAEEYLVRGHVLILRGNTSTEVLVASASFIEKRPVGQPEVEYSVVGPKEAFVEGIDSNLNLIRKRMPTRKLTIRETKVGSISKTRVAVVYLEGAADPANAETIFSHIEQIHFDQIADSSFVLQLISDNSTSPFPQMMDTERPDRVASEVAEGKIAVFVDGSPHALLSPTTLIEFFSAFEDYFLPWPVASAFRLIRLFAVFFSVVSTSLYVAVLTYHYEMIPSNLLDPLISSRSGIPFPPIIEAVILELTIELLREAGARLPQKIGQTIGIVGGIVIGTAAVEAGLTSNVLLIIVSLAALASFTTPIYQMGNTIRLIRFPFIICGQLWGIFGVFLCFGFFISHILNLSSFGRPYIAPVYPARWRDLKDSLFRLPFRMQGQKPHQLRSPDPFRFDPPPKRRKPDIEEI
ncbi:spore germination protein [Bacillus sp. FJAT-42376]|uniref:spore germination protein n=1 Tax=Bacillus sp. FJAT-42376 TaxID=2014076 RepID=UPI000F5062E9|nr:spore germination protein [Bacillus sp. FJAT-42376]AZB43094.1 spore germination protein [Bacillus sp. FJAT-42376]